jgi:dGTPase
VSASELSRLRFPWERARGGRRYGEPPHAFRNEFQRDRDRIVHARAFRRLEQKTQVFTAGVSDHFRNRLTHTIEVAQIARTVARILGLDEDFTEALALAHDIGHPPFAHAGEQELDRLMQRYGEHFDHNIHALRIVESFENPYARFPGLNLTFEVREGIVKHSRDFACGEIPELDEYLPGLRPPLEAQIIDLCDEIAYNTADLDDAYVAGLVTLEEARSAHPQCRELDESVLREFPACPERVRVHEIVRGLINWLVSGLVKGTVVAATGFGSVDEVRRHPVRIARFTPETAVASSQLKTFLRAKFYHSESLVKGREQSTARIAALFDAFMAHPELLPVNYLAEFAGHPLHRLVCDYIAGMTDRFVLQTCAQMNLP